MTQYSRLNPFYSRILERELLSKCGSTKKTYHLSLDLNGSSITYQPGDSVAILPENSPSDVELLLSRLNYSGEETVFDARQESEMTLQTFLVHHANLQKPSPRLLRMLRELSRSDSFPSTDSMTVEELLEAYPKIEIPLQTLPSLFLPMLPRFYSIASSQRLFPNEVHITVAAISYQVNGRLRFGVGTHFLCDRAQIQQTTIPLYIQPSHGFFLPSDPNASIILVGPGTGVAPYRAFLQERLYKNMSGRNWLFFGERNERCDFYYADFWLELEKQERLRLDLAFSRDSQEKVYVQHKMWEKRKDLWKWIEEGAYFYVCGDAKRMAKDVEAMLQAIAVEEGKLSEEEARKKVKELRAQKRYLADVY